MSNKKHDRKLYSVQAMRGVAALLVVVFHIYGMFFEGSPLERGFGAFYARGYAGVDMFFVISGFIMVYVTVGLQPSFKRAGLFLWARVSRIYPVWWVFAALMMLYFFIAYGQAAPPDKVEGKAVLPFISKSLLLMPQKHHP